MAEISYADAGVDVSIEAQASRMMYEASKQTFANREGVIGHVITPTDGFAGLKCIDVSALPAGSCMSLGFDGVGTKVEIAQRECDHKTIAFDWMAMICDDVVVRGAEPVLVGSVLDIKSLGRDTRYLPIVHDMAQGCVDAAKAANVAVINGEIAQLGACISGYGEFPFNWSAACVWFGKKDRLITGERIRPGQSIVLLRERGLRSNGLSLVRKVFGGAHGDEWHTQPFGDSTLGRQILVPSTIYSRLLVRLNGGFAGDPLCDVTGVVHITGGGIPEKFGRVLSVTGLGAHLSDLWDAPEVVLHCQDMGQVSDETAYGTWPMGQGMAVITQDPDVVLREAARMGFEAKVGGIVRWERGVSLISNGYYDKGKQLHFPAHA